MRNLRELLDRLRSTGDLVEVEAPVDPNLEVAEIHRRVIAANGPALLFRSPQGARFPVVTNLFGTQRRVEIAFGERPLHLIRRAVEVAEGLFPFSLGKLWDARDLGRAALGVGTRRTRSGPILEELQREPDLGQLPAITSWPQDGGPFFTLPLVYTEHPRDQRHNLGIYRMQVHGPRRLGVHWQIGKGGGFHYHEAEVAGDSLPVTVFLGGPPALLAGALAPLPENVGELILASLLLGKKLQLTQRPDWPHPLVAEAEFAVMGRVPPKERMPEGPFGDHYGYYSLKHDYPYLELDAIAHRRDAIYPATVVGKPRQEDFYLGDFLQELLSPLFPLVMPSVQDLWSYGETGYHALAAAVVRDRYPREAMVSAFRILGEGQLALTKFLLMTDTPRDLQDFKGLLEHVLARVVWERDLFIFGCLSMDTLDYTGPKVNRGSKGVLLGLGEPVRELPREFKGTPPSGVANIEVYCPGCLVFDTHEIQLDDPEAPGRFAAQAGFADWPLVIWVDNAKQTVSSSSRFLWTVFTRFEPAGDVYSAGVELVRNQPAFRPPILIDARFKEGYPDELFCDDETAKKVDERWGEYFPKSNVEMGDSDRGHLDE